MNNKSPYDVVKECFFTEKADVLSNLVKKENNLSLRRCKKPKKVFIVDRNANKKEIAWAIEKIYEKKGLKVLDVNTLLTKPKRKRLKGHFGYTRILKKAIVTFHPDNDLEGM